MKIKIISKGILFINYYLVKMDKWISVQQLNLNLLMEIKSFRMCLSFFPGFMVYVWVHSDKSDNNEINRRGPQSFYAEFRIYKQSSANTHQPFLSESEGNH